MNDDITPRGDPHRRTALWVIHGATRANTDHGRLYVSLADVGDAMEVSLWSDPDHAWLVARGALSAGNNGPVELEPQNDSGLSGEVLLVNAEPTRVVELDVFYACDDDLAAIQGDIGAFLNDGQFAGRPGFSAATAAARRELDSWLEARGLARLRFDSLRPLADICAHLALAVIYRHLRRRGDDPASELAAFHDARARARLVALRLRSGGVEFIPFPGRVTRA